MLKSFYRAMCKNVLIISGDSFVQPILGFGPHQGQIKSYQTCRDDQSRIKTKHLNSISELCYETGLGVCKISYHKNIHNIL